MEQKQEDVYEELLNELDEEDEKLIIIDYEVEKVEPRFRWEWQHESISEHDSVFKKIWPDR